MNDDNVIEKEIQAKGLTAPRVTPDDIEANIVYEAYLNVGEALSHLPGYLPAPDNPVNLLTICVLVLRNGFTVTGESACASPENFDAELGRKIARQKAISNLWPLMGYALKQHLHDSADVGKTALTEADAAADLAGMPRPARNS